MAAPKEFTMDEVAQHNTAGDAWIVIDGGVYDVTRFANFHPGGALELLNFAGQDCTEIFYNLHRHEVLDKFGGKLKLGTIKDSKPTVIVPKSGEVSPIPWSEASWLHGWASPYFTDSHRDFVVRVRTWFDENIAEEASKLEESGKYPSLELYARGAAPGVLLGLMGVGKHLQGQEIFGVKGEEFDFFHEMILLENMQRMGLRGTSDGLYGGLTIGLPAVIAYGRSPVHAQAVKEVLSGEKRICLCVSEPYVGSDVADIHCTATKTPDGKFYIVNGVKKWITSGYFADYFTTAVRTGGKGVGGISMILIPKGEGVETKAIKTSYSASAGTCHVFFENVKVPVENVLGKENHGFKIIMSNFNHERWSMIVSAQRYSRLAVEECIKWANQREVFGQKLIKQPVIRQKLAHMVARLEAVQAWLEQITFQMCKDGYRNKKVASAISLCKMECTRVAHMIADESVQIFGGRGITRTGMGRVIENFQRTIKFSAILGGAEEILGDMAIRMETKNLPNAKL
jgi:alkylation response protein AidB-like acyl-CoA dehydrogenase/predicted heme/steroid binding protein